MPSCKDVVVHTVVRSVRRCCGQLFGTAAKEPASEVLQLLMTLQFTPRQIHELWRVFQQLRQFDTVTLATEEDETSVESTVRLVRSKRPWVQKILFLLLDLAGFTDTVPWDGFLYVFIQFCTLSKVELCQVLFFIISKHMKSWTVHYLTSTQLEEFYHDYTHCPVMAFNTKSIDFAKLPLAKYRMSDFIELLFRFPQLLNPCLHLQHSLQQALPSLRFWSDYDRIELHNRKITIDFFRYKKVISMFDLITGVQTHQTVGGSELEVGHADADDPSGMAKADATLSAKIAAAAQLGVETAGYMHPADLRALANVQRSPPLADDMPLPLNVFGLELKSRPKRIVEKPIDPWLKEHLKENIHPLHGFALGSAAEEAAVESRKERHEHGPLKSSQRVVGREASIQDVKASIRTTFGTPRQNITRMSADEFVVTVNKRAEGERLKDIQRDQELEFIRRNRREERRRDNMLEIVDRSCPMELIDRPRKKVQGHI